MGEQAKNHNIVLFGEAERGDFSTAYYCENLPQLVEFLGNPPPESRGLYFAIQALLYHRNLVFFRVREEGYSSQDYLSGITLLEQKQVFPTISAICMPGVGDAKIIHAITPLCTLYQSFLITTEADFYDYLTHLKAGK